MSSRISSSFRCLTLLAAAAALALTTGCANMITTAPATNAFSAVGTLSGTMHGGSQVIYNATIKLYAVGTSGYGSSGTLLATTTTSTTGGYSFTQASSGTYANTGSTYVCPTTDTLVYIVGSGGNTQGTGSTSTNNPAAVLLTAIGACGSNGSSKVEINEATTVASVVALAQYINPGTTTAGTASIGSPSTTQALLGIKNAFSTVRNLIDIPTGYPRSSFSSVGTAASVTGVTVTGTVEQAKIDTIANILASCVDTADGTGSCTTLFANAVPPTASVTSQPSATFATAVDTLQAAYYMATNPIDGITTPGTGNANLTALFGLAGGTGAPFQPSLTAQPSDWTIGIGYSSADNACPAGAFFNYLSTVAIDAAGNVWFGNSSASAVASNLGGLSPTGSPIACIGGDTITGNTFGITVDTQNNVWMSSGATAKALEYKAQASPVYWTPVSSATEGIVADGNGNIFYADNTGKTIQEFVGAASAASPTSSVQIGGSSGSAPYYMAVDGLGDIFVTQTSTANTFYEYYPTTAGGNTNGYLSQTILTPGTNLYNTYGVAVSASNRTAGTSSFVVLNGSAAGTAAQSLLPVSVTASTATPAAAPTITPGSLTAACVGGIYKGRGLTIDGAGNSFVAAEGSPNSVAEVAAGGTALSPAFSDSTTCKSSSSTANGGYSKTLFGTVHGLGVDPSGNVWVTQSGSSVGLVEMVGVAVPVVTPTAAGLANNTVGTKP